MPLPQRIDPTTDPCDLMSRWLISRELAVKLVRLSGRVEFPFNIISGYRTRTRQEELTQQGRPTANPDLSTHLSCPATGADLWPDVAVTDVVKARLGAEAVSVGLRWGGGGPVDPETGIPIDWNHFDLGPRMDEAAQRARARMRSP